MTYKINIYEPEGKPTLKACIFETRANKMLSKLCIIKNNDSFIYS